MADRAVSQLVESAIRRGERSALARLISHIENRAECVPEVIALIYPLTGKAEIWGITGPPGAGKSTLVDQMVFKLREKGKKIAVIAVDPSSPFSGGAVLGDRIRMQQHASDPGVYIRSVGTRGRHGGLSHATKEVAMLLDAAGFDVILVETAGVGQTELEILRLAQTVFVVLVPESGDAIQVMKAGLMEIADLFVVNKADRPQADQLVKELIQLGSVNPLTGWIPPVQKTEGVRGIGINELLEQASQHQKYLRGCPEWRERQQRMIVGEIVDILTDKINQGITQFFSIPEGRSLLDELLLKQKNPYEIAALYFDILKK